MYERNAHNNKFPLRAGVGELVPAEKTSARGSFDAIVALVAAFYTAEPGAAGEMARHAINVVRAVRQQQQQQHATSDHEEIRVERRIGVGSCRRADETNSLRRAGCTQTSGTDQQHFAPSLRETCCACGGEQTCTQTGSREISRLLPGIGMRTRNNVGASKIVSLAPTSRDGIRETAWRVCFQEKKFHARGENSGSALFQRARSTRRCLSSRVSVCNASLQSTTVSLLDVRSTRFIGTAGGRASDE